MERRELIIRHAERELSIMEVFDPERIPEFMVALNAILDLSGDRGYGYYLTVLTTILRQENLSPLTDDPRDWEPLSGDWLGDTKPYFWRSIRNRNAFSTDGGMTYYLVNEIKGDTSKLGTRLMHVSVESPFGRRAQERKEYTENRVREQYDKTPEKDITND